MGGQGTLADMNIETFAMERWQSLHEHDVELNLSDSGAHPLTLRELIEFAPGLDGLLDQALEYTPTQGTPLLRERIAALYPEATPANVLVTTGGAEANCVAAWTLVEPGDEVLAMVPNYGQLPGLVRGLGAKLVPWELSPDWEAGCWRADLERLESLVNERTRMIMICNPNNPTGAVFDGEWLDGVAAIADRYGAWVLADEIYQGSEFDAPPTPSIWGRGERVIVTNSLSKAYGLPGLRLGWILSSQEAIENFWARHDYTTIGPGALSDLLAQRALESGVREQILKRTHDMLTRNCARVTKWMDQAADRLQWIPPRAGAMAWMRYDHPLSSCELAERMRTDHSVLLVPGEHFGSEGWLRIGFGAQSDKLERGLERLATLLDTAAV